jgi:hypothetical protein
MSVKVSLTVDDLGQMEKAARLAADFFAIDLATHGERPLRRDCKIVVSQGVQFEVWGTAFRCSVVQS